MFSIKEWNPDLDLSFFYKECKKRGHINNSSKKQMIDCFKNEKHWNVWILYHYNTPIGSVAAHSFDDVMGENSYRILTRTCALSKYAPITGLLTKNKMILEHQHFTAQFFLETCVKWCKSDRLYSTSNYSDCASQKIVNRLYFPTLAKKNLVEFVKTQNYRGLPQNIWKINHEAFLADLNRYPRWKLNN